MKLITKKIQKKLPELYSQEGKNNDMVAYVKYFCPWNHWTWYGCEFDGKDTFFGYVVGLENELGYFSLTELESINFGGLKIERDLYFEPKKLSEIKGGL